MTAEDSKMSALTQELEEKVQLLFTDLKNGFTKVEAASASKQQAMLKDLTAKMQEAKGYDFWQPTDFSSDTAI